MGSKGVKVIVVDGTGCAVIARAMLVVMTLMGTGEAALPVRSRRSHCTGPSTARQVWPAGSP